LHQKAESTCPRATLRSAASVLNGPFSPKLHKKFPKCVSIPGILLFVYTKNYHFKTALHLERLVLCARHGKKRRNPSWIASIFDTVWCKETPFPGGVALRSVAQRRSLSFYLAFSPFRDIITERTFSFGYTIKKHKGCDFLQYAISFLEGMITFISPCLLSMLPIYISYFAGGGERKTGKTLCNACGFVLGFTLVFMAMGALAGTLGSFLKTYQTAVNIVSGLIVVVFGLNFLGVFKLNLFKGSQHAVKTNDMGYFGAFVFGVIFSVGWTP
jgi:hypothetical protein